MVWPWRCFEDGMWHLTGDSWHVTHDTWLMTHDTWQITHDMWKVGEVNILSKFQLPSSNGLAVKVFWRWHVTCDTRLLTRDLWHMTRDTWHMKHNMLEEVDLLSKFQLPSSNGLAVKVFWRWHVTFDMWLVTRDSWHVTRDTWHVTNGGREGGWLVGLVGGRGWNFS